jgi:hypothetical protein
MEIFREKGGEAAWQRNRMNKAKQRQPPPPPPPPQQKQDTPAPRPEPLTPIKDEQPRSDRRNRRSRPTKRPKRPVEKREDSDDCSDEYSDEYEDEYVERRRPKRPKKKPKPPKVVRSEQKLPALRRKQKRGMGEDYLKYGKQFSKIFGSIPDTQRREVAKIVKPEIRRGFRKFVSSVLNTPSMQDLLSVQEAAILMTPTGKALMRDLLRPDTDVFDDKHVEVTMCIMKFMDEVHEQDPPAAVIPPHERTDLSSSDDDEDSDGSD